MGSGLRELQERERQMGVVVEEKGESLKSLEGQLAQAQAAAEEMTQGQWEYRALKGVCFDKLDGAFTYTLCVMGKITQKEVSGREVTLGSYSSTEADYTHGRAAIMRFEQGTHCHAHGARTATVGVTCGAENRLISAVEPSTCAYHLEFASPAACSPQYAREMGIEP
ncbi:glucosidase II beta subunit-like protein-domain-containing protein [Ochromonadaceae sp. CCMP2298]|nr:glucosidase II beta subunit-like protein-domain-containing protein [Ochromonadaceae sp. CCMP2298]